MIINNLGECTGTGGIIAITAINCRYEVTAQYQGRNFKGCSTGTDHDGAIAW